jgi:hypothetical protein
MNSWELSFGLMIKASLGLVMALLGQKLSEIMVFETVLSVVMVGFYLMMFKNIIVYKNG